MRLQIKDFAAIREADIQFDGATVNQTVAVEHLNIKECFGITDLVKFISDVSWSEFFR